MAKRKAKSAQAATREREREIQRDESLRRDQNVSFNAEAKRQAREREDAMANAQRQQNAQLAEQIKEGDYVKVDLESVPQNVKDLALNRYKGLQDVGAHGVSGRVVGVEVTGEGRLLKVDGPTHTLTVPEAAVQRADLARSSKKKATKKKASKKARKR